MLWLRVQITKGECSVEGTVRGRRGPLSTRNTLLSQDSLVQILGIIKLLQINGRRISWSRGKIS